MNIRLIAYLLFLVIFLMILSCDRNQKQSSGLAPNKVVPSEQQIAYQQMEVIGFIHFSINTFTNREWGYGDEDPTLFNPTELDAEQWVLTAQAAGMKELILTAKHHDGFCLWPSEYTQHSIQNSGYKNGEGDIVKEFIEACNKYGLKTGLYLSPWDRNHPDYGKPEYINYYRNQLTELLTKYGQIYEIWFDGANGGEGYYGGACEKRYIDKKTYYDWDSTFKLVKKLQPDILIFSDAGPDIRWIGNEHGFAGETFWSTINGEELIIGEADTKYLNTGDPQGTNWIVGQCDVSIRPGWFYHASEDSQIKSPQDLIDIYYRSVGRNALLLLNMPPDQRGLIHDNDVHTLTEFRHILDKTFSTNLVDGKIVTANNIRSNNIAFSPINTLDNNIETFWASDDKILPAELIIDFSEEVIFDRILIQEPIRFGQRISKFIIEIMSDEGWETVFEGTTIGYKRLLRIDPVSTTSVRLKILESNNTIAIASFGLFLSSEQEKFNIRHKRS